MTSISAASAQTYQSPLQKLQDELLSEVKSGAIKSSDQDALTSALTDIDSAMQASRTSDQASGTRPSPADMKSKIDDLIADVRIKACFVYQVDYGPKRHSSPKEN